MASSKVRRISARIEVQKEDARDGDPETYRVHVGSELRRKMVVRANRERAYTGIDYGPNGDAVSIGLGEVLRVDLTYELHARLRNDRNFCIQAKTGVEAAATEAKSNICAGQRTMRCQLRAKLNTIDCYVSK